MKLSLVGVRLYNRDRGHILGSTIGLKRQGHLVVFSFVLAVLGYFTSFIIQLAKMTRLPILKKVLFCYYANKAFGRWAGFLAVAGIIGPPIYRIMGSQLTALSAIILNFGSLKVPRCAICMPDLPLFQFVGIAVEQKAVRQSWKNILAVIKMQRQS